MHFNSTPTNYTIGYCNAPILFLAFFKDQQGWVTLDTVISQVLRLWFWKLKFRNTQYFTVQVTPLEYCIYLTWLAKLDALLCRLYWGKLLLKFQQDGKDCHLLIGNTLSLLQDDFLHFQEQLCTNYMMFPLAQILSANYPTKHNICTNLFNNN